MKLPLLNRGCRLGGARIWDDSSPPRHVPLWSAWRAEDGTARSVHDEIASRFAQRMTADDQQGAEFAVLCLGYLLTALAVVGVAWLWGMRSWLLIALVFPGWILSMAAARLMFFRRERHELRSFLLARHHCASCGYDLSQVPGGPGELTTCPECGSAWRLGGEGPLLQIQWRHEGDV